MKWVVGKLDRKQQKLWLSRASEAKATVGRVLMSNQHMVGKDNLTKIVPKLGMSCQNTQPTN